MALQVYRYANYLETAERELFRNLCKALDKSKDDYILIANPIIEGRELDALLIKRDAIIVLEFKNYAGALLASEFGDWRISEDEKEAIVVKGGFGGKNPYSQVLRYKWGVINKLKELNTPLINAYHVAGIVVFHRKIEKSKLDFSGKVKTWFHIADMTNVVEKIEDITSSSININDTLWNELPRFFNVEDYLWDEYKESDAKIDSGIKEAEPQESTAEKSSDDKAFFSVSDTAAIETAIVDAGFNIRHSMTECKRDSICTTGKLGLSERSMAFLSKKGLSERDLWKHQAHAILEAKKGNNVCITTSTSSGKTEIFQVSAIEYLEKSPQNKVLAVYPMKALNRQQVERWEKTGYSVGQIDGDIDLNTRIEALKTCRIIVMTPDVMHSFLLARLNDKKVGKAIIEFIKNLSLIIIDELHLFKGVFGTNSAYLFRRLNNVRRLLRKDNSFAQYITASATLPSATEHSFNITGVQPFVEIGINEDTSPISEKIFYYVDPSPNAISNGRGLIADLIYSFTEFDDAKCIAFVEGRQRTGEIANSSRFDKQISDNAEASGIYPYRAGYEKETVDVITKHLNNGNFKGIISTSALEIGIDIEGLNIVIIADMPHDKNSYQQRIGRVGRYGCEKSYVIIVRTDSFASQLLFDEFNYDIDKVLPSYEPALYLEDEGIQNIHALCHVGEHEDCEYKQWKNDVNKNRTFDDGGCFPHSFKKLCQDVLSVSNAPKSYNDAAKEIERPHYDYPLRFFGKQYKIVAANGENETIPHEVIGRDMIVSEGYEGAVRNTMRNGLPIRERVKNINLSIREIRVRQEHNKFVSTNSCHRRFLIPNLREEYREGTMCYGLTKIFNLSVSEYHNIYGYYEIQGTQRTYHEYNITFQLPVLFTSGTLIFHPSLNDVGVEISDVALILFETFLRRNALDRNDINYYGGRLFTSYESLAINDRFVALYDASSLNITARIMNDDLLKDLFSYLYAHYEVISRTICPNISSATLNAIKQLCLSIMDNQAITDYVDVGEEKLYKAWTEVSYLEEESGTLDNVVRKIALLAGKGNIPNTVNLYLDGRPLSNIPIDRIEPTDNTEFETV